MPGSLQRDVGKSGLSRNFWKVQITGSNPVIAIRATLIPLKIKTMKPISLLRSKIAMKRTNAAKEGIGFYLTESDILDMLEKAGIAIKDWSYQGYHLARFNDKGDYEVGNCRFIPRLENVKEKKVSERVREASSKTITAYNYSLTPEQRQEKARRSGLSRRGKPRSASHPGNTISLENHREKFEKVKHLEPHRYGFNTRASKVLGCSSQYVGRMLKIWKRLGFL